jgi:hypothetical protein
MKQEFQGAFKKCTQLHTCAIYMRVEVKGVDTWKDTDGRQKYFECVSILHVHEYFEYTHI